MKSFWDALQEYRALKPANTKIRQLSGEHRRAIQRLQGVQPAKVCTFCAGPCAGRRYKWCSDACINRYWITTNEPGIVDRAVYSRDRGVCARCGLDTDQLKQSVYDSVCEDFDRSARRLDGFIPSKLVFDSYTVRQASDLLCWLNTNKLYQIDHIIPVYAGGGCGFQPGISNLRTLCVPCHRHVSAQQTRHRAKDRKQC